MFLSLEDRLRDAVAAHIRKRYEVEVSVVVETPKQSDFGELATPICFTLAKSLRRAPRQIAEEMVAEIGPVEGIAAFELAGGGYLNVRFDRGAYAEALRSPRQAMEPKADEKIIVEHTNVNPNKAAHIGHLRNAVLGDSLVRMQRALGRRVEVQNYIDNTGVQVADVVTAFHLLEKKSPAQVRALIEDPEVRFDFYCWDLYARISQHYAVEPSALNWRAKTLHAIESGEGELAELARIVADEVVRRHVDTMLRINVEYDMLPRESEILHLDFWSSAFEQLKQRKAIYMEEQGKNQGCWVMPAELFQEPPKKKNEKADSEEKESEFEQSKVIVRSDGTVTYVGKDIAYQLWKFGLIDKNFRYNAFRTYADGRTLWESTAGEGDPRAPQFGAGTTVYNVIDVRQSYLQDVVRAGLLALGYEKQAEQSIHFSYEMVALSPRCCVELGIELSEEDKRRPYVEVSGRKGLGVKADDLIGRWIVSGLEEVRSRHEELNEGEQRKIATEIAVGALRYFMLRFTRTTVIAFDFQEALAFEGETGPYVQYAAVRARNILRKATEADGSMPDFSAKLDAEAMARQLEKEDFWQVLLDASRADWAIARAISAEEPAQLARYAFTLAQAFNNFYHQHHVLKEADPERKVFLLWMTHFFLDQLEYVLDAMGISAPQMM